MLYMVSYYAIYGIIILCYIWYHHIMLYMVSSYYACALCCHSCVSGVGRVGGEQELTVGDDTTSFCQRKGTIMHELGHLIGFWHEHSRPDRDDYVTIVQENIPEYAKVNFRKYDHGVVDSRGVKYDYASIMHYKRKVGYVNRVLHVTCFCLIQAFGNNQVTIIPKQKGVKIGQRKYLSPLDIKQANILYNCKGEVTAVTTSIVW